MGAAVHTLHVILAGAWLGGVLFTTLVVSPALKAMKWGEAERVLVRSKIGKQYAKVGTVNLALLALFAVLEGSFSGFGPILYAEYALLAVLAGLVAAHGAYFGRRLKKLAEAERLADDETEARKLAGRRRRLQKTSLAVSWADVAVSAAVVALATNAL